MTDLPSTLPPAGTPAIPVVRLRGVTRSIREGSAVHPVLAGVDLDLQRGQSAAVTGRSEIGRAHV